MTKPMLDALRDAHERAVAIADFNARKDAYALAMANGNANSLAQKNAQTAAYQYMEGRNSANVAGADAYSMASNCLNAAPFAYPPPAADHNMTLAALLQAGVAYMDPGTSRIMVPCTDGPRELAWDDIEDVAVQFADGDTS